MQVTVYRESEMPVVTQFDVAPRLNERLSWHDPQRGADAMHTVAQVAHERSPSGFTYVIRYYPFDVSVGDQICWTAAGAVPVMPRPFDPGGVASCTPGLRRDRSGVHPWVCHGFLFQVRREPSGDRDVPGLAT